RPVQMLLRYQPLQISSRSKLGFNSHILCRSCFSSPSHNRSNRCLRFRSFSFPLSINPPPSIISNFSRLFLGSNLAFSRILLQILQGMLGAPVLTSPLAGPLSLLSAQWKNRQPATD